MKVVLIFFLCCSFVYGISEDNTRQADNTVQPVKNSDDGEIQKFKIAKRSTEEFTPNGDEDDDYVELDNKPECENIEDDQITITDKNFFVQIISPPLIRFLDVIKIDVNVLNNIENGGDLNAQLIMSDACRLNSFRFFDSKCSSASNNKAEMTKSVIIPHGSAQNVSFYIQTGENRKRTKNFIRISVKLSSGKFEHEVTKRLAVVPPKIKHYDASRKNYNLKPSNPIRKLFYKNISNNDDHHRYSVHISGNNHKVQELSTTSTDLTVTLKNENDFKKVIHITNSNKNDEIEVNFPENSLLMNVTLNGTGYCKVTTIIESTISIEGTHSLFSLNVTTLPSTAPNEKIVRICATYNPKDLKLDMETLFNVIYDAEFPNGYIYKEVVDLSEKPEIKQAIPRWNNSRVQLFFNNFYKNTNYCADIRALKVKESKSSTDEAIMVYNYNDKGNLAVAYYNFNGQC